MQALSCWWQWELYRNNMFAGLAFSSYGGFWLGLGLYGTLAQARASQTHSTLPPQANQSLLSKCTSIQSFAVQPPTLFLGCCMLIACACK